MGVVFGVPGLLLAAPVTAAAMIAVKLLYVEDVVGLSPPVARAATSPPRDDRAPGRGKPAPA